MPHRSSLLLALVAATLATPAWAQSPEPAAEVEATAPVPVATPTPTPVVIRVGTQAVLAIREPAGDASIADRARVIQSRVDQVLLHHPYLTAADVTVKRVGGTPVVYWGAFPIASADFAHAKLNNYSTPDLLASAWADRLREAAKAFFAAKRLPERALYRNERNSDFVYRRTDRTLADHTQLKDMGYIFAPEDFDQGAGQHQGDQDDFVIFARKDAAAPPEEIYLGNGQGTFTAYEIIRPEDQP